MTARVRVGMVGTGYWGKNLLRNFHALGVLAAFCEVREEARNEYARLYPEASVYADIGELLSSDSIDAAVIATPAETHGALVLQALAAGKHVFVEKPLCLNLEEAEQLRRAAKARGLVLMVGHLLLYHGAFQALKRLVQEGNLGRLRYVYSNRLSLGKIRREENALWSFAPHDVSMILQLTGALPKSVVATGGHYLTPGIADTTLSHLAFPGGVQAHIFVSWLHPFKDQRLVAVGSDGMAVFNDTLPGKDKLALYRHGLGWDGDIPLINRAQAEPVDYDDREPLRSECQAFLDAVAQGSRPPSDAEEGIRVLRVLNACQRSIDIGARVSLDEV